MSFFEGKVYIVTGGAQGMGFATTKKIVEAGGYVYVADIFKDISADLSGLSKSQVSYSKCDVTKRDEVQSFVDKVVEEKGRIDGLVAAAGICPFEGEIPPDNVYDKVMDVNVNGVWNFCSRTLVHLKKQGGSLVIFSSGAGYRGIPGLPAYVASKHAVAGLTRTFAKDFAKYNVRVNAVAPGVVDTHLIDAQRETVIPKLLAAIPQGRVGLPEEIADSVLFLLSEKSSYINGQILPINGAAS